MLKVLFYDVEIQLVTFFIKLERTSLKDEENTHSHICFVQCLGKRLLGFPIETLENDCF